MRGRRVLSTRTTTRATAGRRSSTFKRSRGMELHFAAGGVVVRERDGSVQVLLIRDSYGHWTWPKGHLEDRETAEEAAVREVSEETGLERLKLLGLVGKQQYHYVLKGVKVFKTVQVFLMESEGDETLRPQEEEVEEARWMSAEEALGTIEYEGSRDILKEALDKYRERWEKRT
ncbi:MAG: NUDIX domain-containing protein [Candidatus Omnitrophica bacterium]|nr:NUDIX domain-containing protein [Candidatus Omnitrophota bacterium]